jgi:hypothetical protein
MVNSEFVLGGEVGPLLGKESVGAGVTVGDEVGEELFADMVNV